MGLCPTCQYMRYKPQPPSCVSCCGGDHWRSPDPDDLDDLGVETVSDALAVADAAAVKLIVFENGGGP